MSLYNGNETGVGVPGNLKAPYYWWEAGAMMMSLIDYWSYTGDYTYNDQVIEAIVHQSAEGGDFMTPNQTKSLGNDDQAFWAFAALEAAELKFPDPPRGTFSYISLAQGVFNTQAPRWDTETCGGGLKWQIFPFNAGFNYKNAISNGCFFNIGARLARYTGNTTYSDWAEKSYDWTSAIGLIGSQYEVFDGTDDQKNCSDVNHVEFSYSIATIMHGAANMWNISDNAADKEKWRTRVDGFVKHAKEHFFPANTGGVMVEYACEGPGNCNYDMRSFKAYMARWLAATTQLCPWTAVEIMPLLRASAIAAGEQCSGPDQACGLKWTDRSVFDGSTGPGEQMAAMSVIGANLIGGAPSPVTEKTGGTSKGNGNTGGSLTASEALGMGTITTADKAGAGILTVGMFVFCVGGAVWLVS